MMEKRQHSILSTENLSIGYPSKKSTQVITSEIHIELQKDELVALIGVNGSGKSTLLRTLSGLQPSISGDIQINGKGLSNITPAQLAKELAVVLTNQGISKNLTVFELVALGRQPYTNWLGTITDDDQSIIEKALVDTDIIALKDKKCYALSDGQLQRVLIARALAQDSQLILLDEPLTHLDLHHKASQLKLLQSLTKTQNKTVLFSTHDIELALPLCDKIIVLQNGKCVQGTPKQLIKESIFDTLFPSHHITFDAQTGRFSIDN